ncbi:HNH endonuclease [Deinococcus yunweiensis]|uniref:HNH endonuclease n=1 Tax=Deinococcus yunweiensis TaxID=367282 RepID=UPI00398EDE27
MRRPRRSKPYQKRWVPTLGRDVRLHRLVAAESLGRALRPGEVVHHLDGNCTNNAPDNLVVLPSQRHHAALEYHLRRARRGQPPLFPFLTNHTAYSMD